MQTRKGWLLGALLVSASLARAERPAVVCSAVVFEGQVSTGRAFAQQFSRDWMFYLEPISSGWMVRVLRVGRARTNHDAAEIATPPYRSVTPLALTTDFSFRAQDAIGWNPRRFHYAASDEALQKMVSLYAPALGGNAEAVGQLSSLAAAQPEGELTIEDAGLVPGGNDQVPMAAAVASHFETTAHTVEQGPISPLGRITWLKFKVRLELPPGAQAERGLHAEAQPCSK